MVWGSSLENPDANAELESILASLRSRLNDAKKQPEKTSTNLDYEVLAQHLFH
jgi:hypothetical protein